MTINGKPAYLSYVSPTQIDLQAPVDTATGPVPVVVNTPNGTATSTVTLAPVAPSFALADGKHVAGIIAHPDGSYDYIGPTGNSLGYPTVAAKAGDTLELFAVGLGPTNPAVPAGKAFSGSAPTVNPVTLLINNTIVTPTYAGMSSAGLYQINLTIPAGTRRRRCSAFGQRGRRRDATRRRDFAPVDVPVRLAIASSLQVTPRTTDFRPAPRTRICPPGPSR